MATTYEFFKFNGNTYKRGTKVKFTGRIEKAPRIEIDLVEEEIIFLFTKRLYQFVWSTYVEYKDVVYWLKDSDFIDGIVAVGVQEDNNKNPNVKQIDSTKEYYTVYEEKQKEIIWDDWMVAKTLWYIVIMLFATIFYGRVGIWILATVIWWNTTIKNAPRA